MRQTFLDRAIASVSPARGVARAAARAKLELIDIAGQRVVASAGDGGPPTTGGRDRFFGRWSARPASAAVDTLQDLPELRGQSRQLIRQQPLAGAAINSNVTRAIGTGLAYVAQPHLPTLGWSAEQGKEWATEAQAEFSLFADSVLCDWYGDQNFYELQDLALRTMLGSGDAFTVLPDAAASDAPYRLRIQLLEADRCGNERFMPDTPTVTAGIRRPAGGGPAEAFFIYSQHPGSSLLTGRGDGEWFEAVGPSGRRRVLHHFKRLRPEQPRGLPYLAPVMGLFKLLGDYTDAEVKAAVVSAFLTLIIETPTTGALPPPVAGLQDSPGDAGPAGADMSLGPAAILGLQAGEKASVVNPGRPNPAFGDFVGAVVDQLGAGLFIGPEMLMKKYSTSYVAARAAFLDAWKHLLDMRTLIARSFCQPILETWMAEAVAIGRIRAPGFFRDPRLRWAYTRAAWRGDSQGSINPKDEVAAYLQARDGRLISTEHASWELFGQDWSEQYPAMKSEQDRMREDDMLPVPKAGAAAPVAGADQ